jgi:hypothetical protein
MVEWLIVNSLPIARWLRLINCEATKIGASKKNE